MTVSPGNGPTLYSAGGIAAGTLIGSFAAAAVMLWLNYRALGYQRLANKVAVGGVVVYLIIVSLASLMPANPWAGVGFMVLQTGLAYGAASLLQGSAIAYHQSHGGAVHSHLKGALVGLLTGLALLLLLVLAGSLA